MLFRSKDLQHKIVEPYIVKKWHKSNNTESVKHTGSFFVDRKNQPHGLVYIVCVLDTLGSFLNGTTFVLSNVAMIIGIKIN